MNHKNTVARTPSHKDPPVPEILPSGGSGAEERLRAAQHEEGNAPARKGAEKTRDGDEV
jgi:hypothetical protein